MSIKSLIEHKQNSDRFCAPTMFLDEAIDRMAQLSISAICAVTDDGNAAGILTDHDLLKAIHTRGMTGNSINNETVADWMSEYICTCTPDTSLASAVDIMTQNNIHHLVVTEAGRPVAVISLSDVLSQLHANDAIELLKIRGGLIINTPLSAA